MDDQWLATLRCPFSGQNLRRMTGDERRALNEQIVAGTVFARVGTRVQQPIDDGLCTLDGNWLYPIVAAIPQLVAAEAIELTARQSASPPVPDNSMKEVRER